MRIQEPRKPKELSKKSNSMEKKLPILLCFVLLRAGSGHGQRILHDVDGDYGQGFVFASKAAAAETEPLDPSFDDYENEISHVEFEPETGMSYPSEAASAAAPAPGPAAGSAAGSDSMKWWLPPSTIPSLPLFPGMPGIPFKPIARGAPAPPAGADGDADPTAAANQVN